MKIDVLVVDDHEVVRVGILSLLSGTDIKVIGDAADGASGVKLAVKMKPDVVLLDFGMPKTDGLKTLEKLRAAVPASKVIMFSAYNNPTYVAKAVALGASDYVLKGTSRNELIGAITAAAKGQSPSSAGEMYKIATILAKTHVTGEDDLPLTNREAQVLRHLAFGLSNKEIGSALQISVETVKEHVQNIMRKLDLADRTRVAVWAVRKGVV